MQTTSTRTVVTLVLAGALVLTAGCSGIGLGEGDVGASSTEGTAENVTDDRTEATATESESASDDGHSHGVTTPATAPIPTTVPIAVTTPNPHRTTPRWRN